MMTRSGILYLRKDEKEGLRAIQRHIMKDIACDAGGTFALHPGQDEKIDKREVKKATLGYDVIEFILGVT